MNSKADLIISLIQKGLSPAEAGKASATFFEEWKPYKSISSVSKLNPNRKISKDISIDSKRLCHLCFNNECQNIGSCKKIESEEPDFKRKICWYSLFDKCSKGKECSYVHNIEELEIYNIELALEISQVVEDIMKGKIPVPEVSKCKTELCKFQGRCNKVNNLQSPCMFAHSLQERNHHRENISKDILINNILKNNV
jgi:hypothetical protein